MGGNTDTSSVFLGNIKKLPWNHFILVLTCWVVLSEILFKNWDMLQCVIVCILQNKMFIIYIYLLIYDFLCLVIILVFSQLVFCHNLSFVTICTLSNQFFVAICGWSWLVISHTCVLSHFCFVTKKILSKLI